ncbi:unnamed protein product, partial [Rotaria magnacalcarata]
MSTATITNEHDDDGTSNSLKINNRQLLTRRLTGVLENELTA